MRVLSKCHGWLACRSAGFVLAATGFVAMSGVKAPAMAQTIASAKDSLAQQFSLPAKPELDLGKIYIHPHPLQNQSSAIQGYDVRGDFERLRREKLELNQTLERLEAKIRERRKRVRLQYRRPCV